MKKASVLLGTGVLSIFLVSFVGKNKCDKANGHRNGKALVSELQASFTNQTFLVENTEPLSMDQIVYVEIEEEINLGFDTAEYLPKDFNAYSGMSLDINQIAYVEYEEDNDLGFDTADYLPQGFNAYKGMAIDLGEVIVDLNLDDILYDVIEEEIDLGFDTTYYLPQDFDAYSK